MPGSRGHVGFHSPYHLPSPFAAAATIFSHSGTPCLGSHFILIPLSHPLQYSCLENPMDRGAWRATAHRVAN